MGTNNKIELNKSDSQCRVQTNKSDKMIDSVYTDPLVSQLAHLYETWRDIATFVIHNLN